MPFRLVLSLLSASLLTAAPAFAQGDAPAGPGLLGQLLFFIPLILIFYFLLIRPQQQQRKRHQELVTNLKRGDTVVTSGGLIGKLTKVAEQEVTIELAENVRIRVVRNMIADVREKGAPAAAND